MLQTSSDSTHDEIKGATSSSYMLSVEDIGFFISVSCEPVRSDQARGPTVLSDQVGPIISGPPLCRSLEFLGSLIEGERMRFITSYSGGVKGDCLCEWFRTKGNNHKEKLHDGEFLDSTIDEVGDCVELVYTLVHADVDICEQTLTYTPSLEDVGSYLALYWVPTQSDSKKGVPLKIFVEKVIENH